MTATELLGAQHREISALIRVMEATPDDEAPHSFARLAAMLVAHDVVERELFYPACTRKLGMIDVIGKSLVEHGLIEFALYRAIRAHGAADFPFKLALVGEVVARHFLDEEEELFPRIDLAFSPQALADLGAKMSHRYEALEAEARRGPLLEQLGKKLAARLAIGVASKARPPSRRPPAPR